MKKIFLFLIYTTLLIVNCNYISACPKQFKPDSLSKVNKNKKLSVSYIKIDKILSIVEANQVLNEYGTKIYLDNVDWGKDYPYKPKASAQIAYSENFIWILACIKENHIRGHILKDFGDV